MLSLVLINWTLHEVMWAIFTVLVLGAGIARFRGSNSLRFFFTLLATLVVGWFLAYLFAFVLVGHWFPEVSTFAFLALAFWWGWVGVQYARSMPH